VDSFRSTRKKNKDSAFLLLRLPRKWVCNLRNRINEDHIIVLDGKGLWFISGLIVLFSLLIVFKIHYSSIPIWDSILSERDHAQQTSRLMWGTPKFIRIDEWRGVTSFILSQAAQHFPTTNYSLGPGKIPVLMGLPSRHFSALFQPQNWGFFVFGLERGFSFFWNYGVASILLSSFLLCMLISRNRFWLSIFGMLFLFFSSFVQWWFFASMGAMYAAFFFMIISFIYLVCSTRRSTIILSSVCLALFTIDFALWLYPPYMIPLGLFSIACCAGYLMQYCTWNKIQTHFRFRIAVGICCLLFLTIFGIAFNHDLHDTMAQAMNTVYPGKRFSTGGNFGIDRLFSGFYALFFTETRFL